MKKVEKIKEYKEVWTIYSNNKKIKSFPSELEAMIAQINLDGRSYKDTKIISELILDEGNIRNSK
jgi:hypothetical protein